MQEMRVQKLPLKRALRCKKFAFVRRRLLAISMVLMGIQLTPQAMNMSYFTLVARVSLIFFLSYFSF